MLEPWSLNHKKWKKLLAWYLYQRRDFNSAKAIHATSDEEAQNVRRLGYRGTICVIPNGVAIPTNVQRQTEVDIENTERVALYLGRIHPKKGLPMLIEAWSRVRPAHWRIKVVGPDECGHLAELKRLVELKGLTDSWSFYQPVFGEAKWNEYTNADITILPTYSENFGITVAESLAVATPVITTTGTPWKSLQLRGVGWCVEPTVSGLENAIKEVTKVEKHKLREMGALGKRWMADEFSWPAIALQMNHLYQTISESKQ
jgi:glycosyltransferase involved in cell wall biosynthesis